MPFKFYCRNCNQKLEAPDELYGNLIECPQCGGSISVPDPRKMLGSRPEKLSIINMSCPLCGEPGLKLPDSPFGIAICSNCHSTIPFHEHRVHDDPVPLPTLRDYHIVRRLGHGGSGSVYEARQVSLNNRSVAIKILEPEKTAGLDVAAEVAALVRLSHPCIVRIFDLTVTDSIQGIVMELVTGPHCEPLSLRDIIAANGGKLPAEAALAVGRTVCTALDYAHHQGVLHLDLKPDNILVDHLGMLRIVDFGIARSVEAEAPGLDSGGKRTLSGSELGGTPGYVAPERRDAKCPPSAAMDIYSLGAIIYEMLIGEVPGGRFMLPSEINPGMPPEIDAIIDQSLNFHPEKRYPSMGGFGEALGHSLKILRAGSIPQDRIDAAKSLQVNDNTIVIRRPGIGIRDDDADGGLEGLSEGTLTAHPSRPFPWRISLTALSLLILLGYCTFRKPGENTQPPPVASTNPQPPPPPPHPGSIRRAGDSTAGSSANGNHGGRTVPPLGTVVSWRRRSGKERTSGLSTVETRRGYELPASTKPTWRTHLL